MYSEQTLDQIRSQIDIVELVSEYLPLKKAGQSYSGICPFHSEKTGSFHVHPLKQCFHCFGCHKGGNIFTFLCAIEGLSFPKAVQKFAQRLGITLEEDKKFVSRKKEPVITENVLRLREAHQWAAKYFHYLLTEMPEFKFAKDYLNKRGITDETIRKFQLGVSPKGWNTLLDLMLKRKFKFEELVHAGLVIPKENSKTQGYDRFRERLMFPISDADGNKIGFGARILKDEPNQPKYLNSPESSLFSKRSTFYGLHENQRGIRLRGEAVIVEGYMDVVGLFQSGVDNAVATMGTALTSEHCQLIKKLTKKVVTVFDPDKSGIEAWHRSIHLLMDEGLFAKDLTLPEGQDPDEYVLKEGPEKFYKLCAEAPRQISKYLREISKKGQLTQDQIGEYLQELTPILLASKRLPDRALLWDDISLVLKVSVQSLKQLVESQNQSQKPQQKTPEAAPRAKTATPKKLDALDIEFFKFAVFQFNDFKKLPRSEWEKGLKEPVLITWVQKIYDCADESALDRLIQEIMTQETPEQILAIVSARGLSENTFDSRNFPDILKLLKKRIQELEIKNLTQQIKLTQRLGQPEEELKLLEKLKELRAETLSV